MKKMIHVLAAFSLIFSVGYGTLLYVADEIIKPSGPHYTLNIIGVEKGKNPKMTNSDRHTIFVALGSKSQNAITDIYLQPGDFQVCDGNGFDAAYDCSGAQIKAYPGATFQLPCNTVLTYDPTYGCPAGVEQRSYYVNARALGKPGFEAHMRTCIKDEYGELLCSLEELVLKRSTGRSFWQDATATLTSVYADVDNDGTAERVALFADGFEDFLWQYDNFGLRHAQIRFYPVSQ
jgi:hypothetical protein